MCSCVEFWCGPGQSSARTEAVRILDREIIVRFFWNFFILFALLYVFAAAVDTVLQMDKYVEAAIAGARDGLYSNRVTGFITLLGAFHGPRIFQFFQFMMGLLCVGAMGFTFAQMHRTRELVAIMAAGVPLRRCVWAVLAAAFCLNVAQIVNQEVILPRLADRLITGHSAKPSEDPASFTVPLTRDKSGNLLYAGRFDPHKQDIKGFLALERDAQGRLLRRTTADSATWDAAASAWVLTQGAALDRDPAGAERVVVQRQAIPVERYATDLSPKVLTARHYSIFAQLLSTPELSEIAAAGAIDPALARRMQIGRWGSILVNLLVLAMAVPYFLQRGPTNMLQQSVTCAAVCVPAIIVSAILMAAPVSGLPPTVMVALPVAVLVPIAAARLSWLPS